MPDDQFHGDALAMEALLYASGELAEEERAAFEQRLGEDQAAREALCQAVQLSQALRGERPAAPDQSYRGRVRRRLTGAGPRLYRGHPLLWAVSGAAAAVLVMLGLGLPEARQAGPPSVVQVEPRPVVENNVSKEEPMLEVANHWAELHNSNHLEKALTDEARRRLRAEERLRPPSATTMKN
jgi:anti-sigma factor RsiW